MVVFRVPSFNPHLFVVLVADETRLNFGMGLALDTSGQATKFPFLSTPLRREAGYAVNISNQPIHSDGENSQQS